MWTMGKDAGFTEPPPWRLCTIAGPGGELSGLGELAMVCSRPVGSRRPRGCGKSPKELAFAVPGWARGNVYPSPLASLWADAAPSLAARLAGLRRRAAAPDSSPSFFSSSALQPSLVART